MPEIRNDFHASFHIEASPIPMMFCIGAMGQVRALKTVPFQLILLEERIYIFLD
jgi:hypothetical protein